MSDILEKIDRANFIVSSISTGEMKWRMSVPADEENDPDLVLSNTLHEAKKEIINLRGAINRLKPHIWERYMVGESDYERAVIALLELVKEN